MMNESNSIELIDRASLIEETKFQLDVISKIENFTKRLTKENHAAKN